MVRTIKRNAVSFRDEVDYQLECKTTGVEKLVSEDDAWAGRERYRRMTSHEDGTLALSKVHTAGGRLESPEEDEEECLDRQRSIDSIIADEQPLRGPSTERSNPFENHPTPNNLPQQAASKHPRFVDEVAGKDVDTPPSPPAALHIEDKLGQPEPLASLNRSGSVDSTSSQGSIKRIAGRVFARRTLINPLERMVNSSWSSSHSRRSREQRRQDAEDEQRERELRDREQKSRRRQAEQAEREDEIRSMQGLYRVRSAKEAEEAARAQAASLQRELEAETARDANKDQTWSSYNDRQAKLKALRTEREQAKAREKKAKKEVSKRKAQMNFGDHVPRFKTSLERSLSSRQAVAAV